MNWYQAAHASDCRTAVARRGDEIRVFALGSGTWRRGEGGWEQEQEQEQVVWEPGKYDELVRLGFPAIPYGRIQARLSKVGGGCDYRSLRTALGEVAGCDEIDRYIVGVLMEEKSRLYTRSIP